MFRALTDSEQRKRSLDSTHLLEAEAQLKAGRPKDALALAPLRDDNLSSREKWRLHQVIGRSLYLTGRISEARKHLEAAIEEGQRRASSQRGESDRAVTRREGFEVYRTLAEILVDQGE